MARTDVIRGSRRNHGYRCACAFEQFRSAICTAVPISHDRKYYTCQQSSVKKLAHDSPETRLKLVVQVEKGLPRRNFRAPLYGVLDIHEDINALAEHRKLAISVDVIV